MTFDEIGDHIARQFLFVLVVACTFVLGLFLMLMSSALWERPGDGDTQSVFGFAAVLFTLSLLFVIAGLITRPAWAKWLVAALLFACPILLFSGALTWLINLI